MGFRVEFNGQSIGSGLVSHLVSSPKNGGLLFFLFFLSSSLSSNNDNVMFSPASDMDDDVNDDDRDKPSRYTNVDFIFPDGTRKRTDLYIDGDGLDVCLIRDYDSAGRLYAVTLLQTGLRLGVLDWQTVRAQGRLDPGAPAASKVPRWVVRSSHIVAYVTRAATFSLSLTNLRVLSSYHEVGPPATGVTAFG